jgi:hypothetical protein
MTSLLPFAHSFFFAQVESSTHTEGKPPGPIFWIIWAAFIIFMIASLWKLFSKAGQPGWAAIIPIVNTYFLCKVAGRPGWWVLLMLIPLVNFVIWIIISIDVAKNFGKGTGFGVGVAFLSFIFVPILAFGSAQYQGAPAK